MGDVGAVGVRPGDAAPVAGSERLAPIAAGRREAEHRGQARGVVLPTIVWQLSRRLQHRQLECERVSPGDMRELVDHALGHEHRRRWLDRAPLPAWDAGLNRRVANAHVRHDARRHIVRLELTRIDELRLTLRWTPTEVVT